MVTQLGDTVSNLQCASEPKPSSRCSQTRHAWKMSEVCYLLINYCLHWNRELCGSIVTSFKRAERAAHSRARMEAQPFAVPVAQPPSMSRDSPRDWQGQPLPIVATQPYPTSAMVFLLKQHHFSLTRYSTSRPPQSQRTFLYLQCLIVSRRSQEDAMMQIAIDMSRQEAVKGSMTRYWAMIRIKRLSSTCHLRGKIKNHQASPAPHLYRRDSLHSRASEDEQLQLALALSRSEVETGPFGPRRVQVRSQSDVDIWKGAAAVVPVAGLCLREMWIWHRVFACVYSITKFHTYIYIYILSYIYIIYYIYIYILYIGPIYIILYI